MIFRIEDAETKALTDSKPSTSSSKRRKSSSDAKPVPRALQRILPDRRTQQPARAAQNKPAATTSTAAAHRLATTGFLSVLQRGATRVRAVCGAARRRLSSCCQVCFAGLRFNLPSVATPDPVLFVNRSLVQVDPVYAHLQDSFLLRVGTASFHSRQLNTNGDDCLYSYVLIHNYVLLKSLL